MPELPEVETVRRTLEPLLPGRTVERVWTSGKPLRLNRPIDTRALRAAAVGHRVTCVDRRAKYLLVHFDAGAIVVVHLGMTGRLAVTDADAPRAPHTHVALSLDDGRELRFVDPRRFGLVAAFPRGAAQADAWPELAKLGVDPLSAELTAARVHELARTTARGLKLFLLDQSKIAGLGNIYVCEALWEAGLHPHKRARTITWAQAAALRDAIVLVLRRSLDNRGTTLRDYRDASGEIGFNQLSLRAYGRAGEPCPRCKAPIRGVVTQGRGTFYCPKCQSR
jgi:formamidopyrimidine-DNA glycosylase